MFKPTSLSNLTDGGARTRNLSLSFYSHKSSSSFIFLSRHFCDWWDNAAVERIEVRNSTASSDAPPACVASLGFNTTRKETCSLSVFA